jgi:hypothetical protein
LGFGTHGSKSVDLKKGGADQSWALAAVRDGMGLRNSGRWTDRRCGAWRTADQYQISEGLPEALARREAGIKAHLEGKPNPARDGVAVNGLRVLLGMPRARA